MTRYRIEVCWQGYDTKEKDWYTYNDEDYEVEAENTKEAFYKIAKEELNLDDAFIEKAWKGRNRIERKLFVDGPNGEAYHIGFITPSFKEIGDDGKEYLARLIVSFEKLSYDVEF